MTLPALFVGHGSPMNALAQNAWTTAWAGIGRALPRPRAILVEPYPWAVRFERAACDSILADDVAALVDYPAMGEDARLSVPTPEHFLPLSVVLGLRAPGEPVSFPVEGIDGGSISMLSVLVGGA